MRLIAFVVVLFTLSGCATLPSLTHDDDMCHFRMESSIIDDPDFENAGREQIKIPQSTLILSGGGEKGAFGAGYLKGWARKNGGQLPDFTMVTGISTGAILATWAFVGDYETIAREYAIPDESQILTAYAKPSKSGGLGFGAALALIRHNSLGDLSPLRQRLKTLLNASLLSRVAEKSGELRVGAVEVDVGELQLFDIKEMAQRAISAYKENNIKGFERYRDCYVEAILASSSVPVGAKPVFIDNRMYIDGGVRQGIFVNFMAKILRRGGDSYRSDPVLQTRAPDGRILAPQIYVIMNGTQWSERICSKIDKGQCNNLNHFMPDPVSNGRGQHKKWDIVKLALRTTDILANQSYRFSAKHTESQYKLLFPESEFKQRFYFTRMHRTALNGNSQGQDAFEFEINGVKKTCPGWRDYDKDRSQPLQFHPQYMACLQAYGEYQADLDGWFKQDKPSQFEENKALQ